MTPLFMVGEVAMEVLIPTLMATIIDEGVYKGNMPLVIKVSIFLVMAAMISLVFGILGAKFASKASAGFAKNLRHDIFYRIQLFSFSNIDSFSSASLITRMTTDVQNVQQAFQMVIRICVRAPIMFVFALLMVARNGGSLILVFATAIPVLSLVLFTLMSRSYPLFSNAFKSYDLLNRVVEENVTNIRTVKAYVREGYEYGKFEDSSARIHDAFVSAEKLMQLTSPAMMIVAYSCVLAISYFGTRFIVRGMMGTGQLMSVISYTMQILSSLMMIAMIVVMLAISRVSAQRIAEVLNTTPDMDENNASVKTVQDGSIDFEHVDFSYSDHGGECLKDIDVHIASGESIGIMGLTGSGKTSFVSLVARLYDVSKGCVKVGGADVRDYRLSTLRNAVSIVLQKNQLFSGTIRSNLAWGNPKADDTAMKNALKAASATFVDNLDSVVEQGGNNFSGGQKQRLCIARALLKNPKVLIFDDSTSAVDTATDKAIRASLKKEAEGCTKLIISQRVLSIMDADRIIMLDNGRIADIGSHAELLERNREYQDLCRVQLKEEEK